MHHIMAVRLWVTRYSLIMIFSNKTFFVRKALKVIVLSRDILKQTLYYLFYAKHKPLYIYICVFSNEVILTVSDI